MKTVDKNIQMALGEVMQWEEDLYKLRLGDRPRMDQLKSDYLDKDICCKI